MGTVVFRLLFVPDIHYTFTIGVGHVYLLFQFPWEHWPKGNVICRRVPAFLFAGGAKFRTFFPPILVFVQQLRFATASQA